MNDNSSLCFVLTFHSRIETRYITLWSSSCLSFTPFQNKCTRKQRSLQLVALVSPPLLSKTDFFVVTFTEEPTTIYTIMFTRIYKAEYTAHIWISKLKKDHIHTTGPYVAQTRFINDSVNSTNQVESNLFRSDWDFYMWLLIKYRSDLFEIWPQSEQVEDLYRNSSLQHARLMFIKTVHMRESQSNKQTKQGRQQRRQSVEGLWGYYVGWCICPRKNPRGPTVTVPCLNVFSIKWPKGDTGERGCSSTGNLRGWMPNLKRLNAPT